MTNRFFIHLAYNGKNYHGWQVQPNAPSVQATLDDALQTILREKVHAIGSGRTDTGVHASCMYAHFDIEKAPDIHKLIHALNSLLPHDIAVYNIRAVEPDAHTRFDAITRTYQYRVHFKKSPFLEGMSYRHFSVPDMQAMNVSARYLLGEQNFRAFEKTRAQENTGICNITRAEWVEEGEEWVFHITANRFLRNMVRAIVGTLLDVGMGKMNPDNIIEIIKSQKRVNAGTSVPPQGLYLADITYPEHIFI
jgi:tRNA pseudouridine38-40 synthase